jgi:NADH-quinone oxidoreductase subunit F
MSSRQSDAPTVRVAGEGARRLAAGSDADIVVAGPTGHPALEPLLVASVDGEALLVPRATEGLCSTVVDVVDAGELPVVSDLDTDTVWTAEHDDPRTLPVPDAGPLATGVRYATARCGWAAPESVEAYRDWGVVAGTDPDTVVDRVADAGLLGRGRTDDAADEAVADNWRLAREAAIDPVDPTTGQTDPVVVVNANEADHAVAGDTLLLESDPFAVLDGALAVARAVGATDLVVYVGETARTAADRANLAGEALASPLDDAPTVQVAAGPETYTAGEPTMAIESLQGKERLEARRRPPGPAEWGLYGRPTLVHTPRTFAQVRALLAADEDEADAKLGTSADPGTRLVTVSGDVESTATVELPTDASLSDAMAAVDPTESAKAYRVGGRFGGITRRDSVPVGANALSGADLGTAGGVELLGRSRCMLATIGESTAFAEDGNCGRCVPCREGSQQLANLLREVYNGEYDDGGIRELARVMRETSLCAFGRDAARPVLTALSTFENEVAAHADGRCPAGACEVGR